jgi:hypothetical protein
MMSIFWLSQICYRPAWLLLLWHTFFKDRGIMVPNSAIYNIGIGPSPWHTASG